MPYLATSQEWSQQSLLLLQARPASTRITTKYKILDPSKETKRQRTSAPKKEPASTDASTSQPPTGPKGVLVLKTFDPVSGACLKYKTNKAAEVGRLIAGLGKLGREMAALPELPEDAAALEIPTTAGDKGTGRSTPVPEASKAAADNKNTQGAGGGKKKKKGKK